MSRASAEKPAANWEERFMRRPPIYKIVAGFLYMTVMFYGMWTIAFAAGAFIHGRGDKEALWEALAAKRELVAAVWREAGDTAEAAGFAGKLAEATGVRVGLADEAGRARWFGGAAGGADGPAAEGGIGQAELEAMLGGRPIRLLDRPNPFRDGTAAVGGPLTIGRTTYALIVQAPAPGLFHDYRKQLTPLLLIHALLLAAAIAGFLFGAPRQLKLWTAILDALRRIARGDFDVRIEGVFRQKRGKDNRQFAVLIEGINDMASGLKQIENMRQEFISNVSHEIQSPLTSIGGFAKALRGDSLRAEERDRYLSIIELETERLSKLSDNLLKLSSLDSERHPFERSRYRVDKQLRHLILACEPQWEKKRLEMDVDLEAAYVYADEQLMGQVWTNLLHNSIKFTPEGGAVRIRAASRGGTATIEIADTGIGMSDKELAQAFDRFYKADASRNRALGGSGLGLSIVRKIVDMHGGAIRMDSRVGEGTTVVVTLPESASSGAPNG
ncbi:sensor histidine kinase [Paenibacillus sp. GYB003]|uniref:sensor histidine kinase n=1 Tax=Paenibacillus sp. GYB003 TaxID=2994392 RepID=UPI002F967447